MKVSYHPELTNPELPGIVVLSHGPLALGMLESAAFIYGEPIENSAAFCIEPEDSIEEYKDRFMEAVMSYPKGCLVFTDIFGGTPCNQLILHCKRNGIKATAIGGVCLSMILNAAYLRTVSSGPALVEQLLKEGQESMVNITAML